MACQIKTLIAGGSLANGVDRQQRNLTGREPDLTGTEIGFQELTKANGPNHGTGTGTVKLNHLRQNEASWMPLTPLSPLPTP